jgi:hypothetical protein
MLNICVAHIQYIVNVNVHLCHLIHKYTADYYTIARTYYICMGEGVLHKTKKSVRHGTIISGEDQVFWISLANTATMAFSLSSLLVFLLSVKQTLLTFITEARRGGRGEGVRGDVVQEPFLTSAKSAAFFTYPFSMIHLV